MKRYFIKLYFLQVTITFKVLHLIGGCIVKEAPHFRFFFGILQKWLAPLPSLPYFVKNQRLQKSFSDQIYHFYRVSQKKMWFKPIYEFLTLEGVFLGVKNNSKNFGNKKNIGLFSKILSKWTLLCSQSSNFLEF